MHSEIALRLGLYDPKFLEENELKEINFGAVNSITCCDLARLKLVRNNWGYFLGLEDGDEISFDVAEKLFRKKLDEKIPREVVEMIVWWDMDVKSHSEDYGKNGQYADIGALTWWQFICFMNPRLTKLLNLYSKVFLDERVPYAVAKTNKAIPLTEVTWKQFLVFKGRAPGRFFNKKCEYMQYIADEIDEDFLKESLPLRMILR